jgi:hypothetical protein
MKNTGSGFFWPSFTDLMTSLFFIMLVLYVLTYVKLKYQQKATNEQLKTIKEIQAAVQELPKEYFAYDSTYKRFSLVRNIEFETQKDIIKSQDTDYLLKVGTSIKVLIDTLKRKYTGQDIKYVVIIEGMSSNDQYIDNYPLSYKRARAIRVLWIRNKIHLDQSICEVQVSGSGTGGIGRYPVDEDKKNQRILIQIVPKIGNLKIE